jgi:hypothetical protein
MDDMTRDEGGSAAPPQQLGNEPLPEWMGGLPDTHRQMLVNNHFHRVKGADGASRFATVGEAAANVLKGLAGAETLLRERGIQDAVRPPKKGETHGDWARATGLAERLGIPDAPEAYKIEPPKFLEAVGLGWDAEWEGRFRVMAHKHGMSQDMAQLAAITAAEGVARMVQNAQQQAEQAHGAMLDELTQTWKAGGREVHARLNQASRAFQEFADRAGIEPELRAGMVGEMAKAFGGGAKGDAAVIRLFAALAQSMAEDRIVTSDGPAPGFDAANPTDARARLAAIKAPGGDWEKARIAGNESRMKALRAEMSELAKTIAGRQPRDAWENIRGS